MNILRTDFFLVVAIFLLTLAVRLPFISYPHSVLFDEGIYATFTARVAYNKPFFDVHPPLATLVFSEIISGHAVPPVTLHDIGAPFGDFPYIPLRVFNVFLGSLLAAVIFLCAQVLYDDTALALAASLLVVFDNALVEYSRMMLPDTLLVVLGFSGLLFFLLWEKNKKAAFLVVSGVFFGLAISVKWLGLAFLGVAALILLSKWRLKEVAALGVIAGVVYISVFVWFFTQVGGSTPDMLLFPDDPSPHVPYPAGLRESLAFLPAHTLHMFRANFLLKNHPSASAPFEWPFGRGALGVGAGMVLAGNLAGWFSVCIAVIAAFLLLILKKEALPRGAKVCLLGYAVSYIPLFFIRRRLFLYHYFTPLLFGYLLVPSMIPLLLDMMGIQTSRKKTLFVFSFIVLGVYLLLVPKTYPLRSIVSGI